MGKIDKTESYFIATIWPTASEHVRKITKFIRKRYSNAYMEEFDFEISWDDMVRSIYMDDRVKERNIIAKIEVMSKFPKKIYLIYIPVPKPKYRYKKDRRRLSTAMEKLKKEIRSKYGSKGDVSKNPIHIVDEYSHSINYDKFLDRLK